jgi:hypothetical protein
MLLVVGLLALSVAVPMTGSELGFGGSLGPSASPAGPTGSVAGLPSATPAATPVATPEATPATPSPIPTPALADVPIVPVTQFRATFNSTNLDEVKAVLGGTSRRYEAVALVESQADAILAALGVGRPTDADRLVLAPTAAKLSRDLAKHRKRLAFLRADDVTPAVRSLAWAGRALFGNERMRSLADWRLMARLPEAPDGAAFDPATTWTMFAGGDILLDRGVYQTVRIRGKGADFPFDGGTAEITSRCKDCSPLGWDLPRTRRTGHEGAVRALISGADIAIANFENPAPNASTFHTRGTRFTADPRLISGLAKAGIDYVSLANNHIGDAGDLGILQTIANLKKHGLKYSGAGKDLAAARKPAILKAAGTTVAILGYDAIARAYFAGPDETGSSQLSLKRAKVDIKKARAAGADLVVVFPHWGVEYRNRPFTAQQRLARDIIDAGADMIIGNHAHWVGAVEVYKGKPIWYALGNFVFDQTWSEPTMEGITLELTFQGSSLRQIRMRPHIILDKSQPNFLDPAGDGKAVLGPMYDASKGLLPY